MAELEARGFSYKVMLLMQAVYSLIFFKRRSVCDLKSWEDCEASCEGLLWGVAMVMGPVACTSYVSQSQLEVVCEEKH